MENHTIKRILQFGWIDDYHLQAQAEAERLGNGRQGPMFRTQALLNGVRTVVTEFAAKVDGVRESKKLTDAGQLDALQEVGRAALVKISERYQRVLPLIEGELARLKAELESAAESDMDTTDRVVQTLQIMEVRQALSARGKSEVFEVLQTSIRDRDAVTFLAITTAPKVLQTLTAQAISEAQQQWLESLNPDLSRRLQECQQAVGYLQQVREEIDTAITSECQFSLDPRERFVSL